MNIHILNPQNEDFDDEFSFSNRGFSGSMLIFRGVDVRMGDGNYGNWIFQVCRICAFSPRKPTQRQKF